MYNPTQKKTSSGIPPVSGSSFTDMFDSCALPPLHCSSFCASASSPRLSPVSLSTPVRPGYSSLVPLHPVFFATDLSPLLLLVWLRFLACWSHSPPCLLLLSNLTPPSLLFPPSMSLFVVYFPDSVQRFCACCSRRCRPFCVSPTTHRRV